MSLNWNIAECENFEELLEGREWRITEVAIFQTMHVGISSITEDNYVEFWTRNEILHTIGLSPLVEVVHGKTQDRNFTLDEVKRRVGLRTNASAKTPAVFRKMVLTELERQAEIERKRQEKAIAKR